MILNIQNVKEKIRGPFVVFFPSSGERELYTFLKSQSLFSQNGGFFLQNKLNSDRLQIWNLESDFVWDEFIHMDRMYVEFMNLGSDYES